jgi:hypothetical protein
MSRVPQTRLASSLSGSFLSIRLQGLVLLLVVIRLGGGVI